MLIVSALVLLAGLALTTLGLRGRRVDDHPLCRRCRFDLTGRAADSTRCPECGADVTRPRATVIGHRRRRRGPLAAGVGLLVPAVVGGGLLGYGAVTDVNWLRFAPVAYLVREGTSADPARRGPAWAELRDRRAAGSLTPAAVDRASDAALAYQADPAKPWDPAVGNWLDDARAAGHLSDDRWHRYAAAAWPTAVGLRVRPLVRAGDPIPYWVDDDAAARVGTRSVFRLELRDAEVGWDDRPPAMGQSHSTSTHSLSTGGSSSGSAVRPDAYAGRLPVGHHLLRLRTPVRILTQPGDTAPAVATGTLDLSAPFDLLPADRPTVKMVHDPALAPRVRAALAVEVRHQAAGGYTNVSVNVNGAPVGLGFAVFLRAPGRPDARVGTVACPAGTANHGYGIGGRCPAQPGSRVDVVLRGDAAAAAETTDTAEAWDGEVVFPGVVVQ